MANVLNVSLDYVPTTQALNSPVKVTVKYTVRFTPMEHLLAAHGLRFRARIRLYDVDEPVATLLNDDLLDTRSRIITSAEILGAVNNTLTLPFTHKYNRPELRGPDDDGSEFFERLRAQVCVYPIPHNAAAVSDDCGPLSNIKSIDTHGQEIVDG